MQIKAIVYLFHDHFLRSLNCFKTETSTFITMIQFINSYNILLPKICNCHSIFFIDKYNEISTQTNNLSNYLSKISAGESFLVEIQ